jgi:Ca2+-binding RTX toxin-like protein
MMTALLLASGVALAVNKIGTNGPDTLRGTNAADNLDGRGGNDVLYGLGGRDNLLGEEARTGSSAATNAAPREEIRTWWAVLATMGSSAAPAPTTSWGKQVTTS